ncbi:hypothetical protein ACFX1S_020553 [Malus domestica]
MCTTSINKQGKKGRKENKRKENKNKKPAAYRNKASSTREALSQWKFLTGWKQTLFLNPLPSYINKISTAPPCTLFCSNISFVTYNNIRDRKATRTSRS